MRSWFDERQSSVMQYGFFSEPLAARAAACKAARGGGSVPPLYMDDVRALESKGRLSRVVGEVQVTGIEEGSVNVTVDGEPQSFDVIVNACGHRPSCLDLPLLADLQTRSPVETVGGLPVLSSDLQWGGYKNLYLVGALASLQVGPDAGNLMGLGRAAQMVTDSIGGKAFSKYKNSSGNVQGWYKANRFAEAFDSSDDEEEEEEEEEEDSDETEESEGDKSLSL